jgi:hypothetical protein
LKKRIHIFISGFFPRFFIGFPVLPYLCACRIRGTGFRANRLSFPKT